jgi:hypothetical protein
MDNVVHLVACVFAYLTQERATMKAPIFKNIGEPREVLRLEDIEEAKPGQAEVLLRMLFSPVNPSDMHMVRGRYGYQPSLPASPGAKSPMHSSTLLRAKYEFMGSSLALAAGQIAVTLSGSVRSMVHPGGDVLLPRLLTGT